MYDYLIDQAQARRERVWAEIEQDRLIGQVKKTTHKSSKGVSKMRFNRQKVASLLLAGSILAAVAGLIGAEVSFSQANRGTDLNKTGAVGYDSGLSPEFYLRSITGSKPTGGDVGK